MGSVLTVILKSGELDGQKTVAGFSPVLKLLQYTTPLKPFRKRLQQGTYAILLDKQLSLRVGLIV